jgi:hypothetical protein
MKMASRLRLKWFQSYHIERENMNRNDKNDLPNAKPSWPIADEMRPIERSGILGDSQPEKGQHGDSSTLPEAAKQFHGKIEAQPEPTPISPGNHKPGRVPKSGHAAHSAPSTGNSGKAGWLTKGYDLIGDGSKLEPGSRLAKKWRQA